MNRTSVIASIIGVALLTSSAAYAGAETTDSTSVKVNAADLNLMTAAGAKAMLGRLKLASQSICGPAPRPADLQAMDSYRACFKETLASAVATVNAPLVSVAAAQADGKSTLVMAKSGAIAKSGD